MKNKFYTIGLPIMGGLLIAGVGIASAAGFMGGGAGGFSTVSPTTAATNQAAQFQAEASETGLSESIIVAGWAQGESLSQIATANGITAAQLQTGMKTYETAQQNAELQALVTNGTITQAQMTQRLAAIATQQAAMQTNMQNASGTWSGGGHGGFSGMRGHKASTSASTSGTTSNSGTTSTS